MYRALVGVLLLLFTLQLAKAEVVVNSTDAKAVKAVSILHKRVPSAFLASPMKVYIKYGFTDWSLYLYGVVGVYYDVPKSIELDEHRKGIDVDEDLTHEYAHFVWFNLMTEDEKRDYSARWEIWKILRMLPTQYAGSKASEGFAEDFSMMVCNDPAENKYASEVIRKVQKRLENNCGNLSATGN